jgi:hypothetical protein
MIGAGFRVLDGESERGEVIETPKGAMRVRTAQFIKDHPTGTINQRMLWTFSHSGEWEASELGRASLAGQAGWFKLYVTTAAAGNNVLDTSESKGFLEVFIPRLNDALFSSPKTESAVVAQTTPS